MHSSTPLVCFVSFLCVLKIYAFRVQTAALYAHFGAYFIFAVKIIDNHIKRPDIPIFRRFIFDIGRCFFAFTGNSFSFDQVFPWDSFN